MKPFREPFSNLSNANANEIIRDIENLPDEYFESVPLEEYAEYLISKFTIEDFPIIQWNEIELDFGATEVPGRDLPREFFITDPNQTFSRSRVEYHVPVSGNAALLKFHASNVISTSVIKGTLTLESQSLCFIYVDVYNDSNKVEQAFKTSKNTVIGILNVLEKEFNSYQISLPGFVKSEINKRVGKIIRANEYKSKFSYPVKKKDVPTAFVSPRVVKKKKIAPKPAGKSNSKTNERFISEEDYMHILEILQDCGKNWEQHPEIYKGKDEEALRDQLIFVLAPNIEGVVAGEAYNKKGKTDIAIKFESTNLFIGECKIWKGPKGFIDTIDQIIGYLTWRDSKAAILMFVQNKDISNVKSAAKEVAVRHPNFVRILDEINEGWINYRFHIQDDPGTYLTLAVQLYHLPDS